ncbi:MAG: peptidylprolyl isomerase, partial [Pyrinomonadaceae bacterium]
FDTTTFSRIVKGFVIQGGNVTTSERLTPQLIRRASRTIIDEPNSVKHERGIVSMARSASPNTATTSFFILAGAAPHLDRSFAAFGRVLRGMEAVDAINTAPAEENEKPDNPVRIKRAAITRCPPAAAVPPAVVAPTPPPAPKEPAGER